MKHIPILGKYILGYVSDIIFPQSLLMLTMVLNAIFVVIIAASVLEKKVIVVFGIMIMGS